MASSNMGHRDALNELAKGQEVKERLRSILRLSPLDGGGGSGGVEMPSVIVSGELLSNVVAAPASTGGGGEQGESSSYCKGGSVGQEKNRKKLDSWSTTSCAPYDDGFQWRKYGEKKISKPKFTRSYFRCSYRDDEGCMATKQVQQKELEDPPLFLIKYCNEHTCSYKNSPFLTNASYEN